MYRLHPLKLCRKGSMVGGVIRLAATRHLVGIRDLSVQIDWQAIEIGQRAKIGGVLLGIKTVTGRVAIDVYGPESGRTSPQSKAARTNDQCASRYQPWRARSRSGAEDNLPGYSFPNAANPE